MTLTLFIKQSMDSVMLCGTQLKVREMRANSGLLNFLYRLTTEFPAAQRYLIKHWEKKKNEMDLHRSADIKQITSNNGCLFVAREL